MKTQNGKILIAYTSQFGSTAGIADAIKKELGGNGAKVETKAIKDVKDLHLYDAVIIGSPIQYDKWVPETTEFVTTNQEVLEHKPVAFFFSCMALSLPTEKSKRQGKVYSDYLLNAFPKVKPFAVGQFAGALNMSKMSLIWRLVFKLIMAKTGAKEGDHRDWNAIRRWSKDVDKELSFAKG